MLVHLLGIFFLCVIGLAFYFLFQFPHRGLKNVLSVHDLGRLEGGLGGLREVIVVADYIEPPTDELRHAVEQNLARGVRYHFLVSQRNAQRELNGYYRLFQALAKIVIARSESTLPEDALVTIDKLPYDWVDVPYVFYKVTEERLAQDTRYIAVRGNQRREGIADYYKYVEPEYAHMIAQAILSVAPTPIVVEAEEFAESNVVEFDPTRRTRGSS